MDNVREELDGILREFLSSDKQALKTVAMEMNAIVEAHEAGEITDDMKDELVEDVAEVSRVETAAEVLETKLRVEKAIKLLSTLIKLV